MRDARAEGKRIQAARRFAHAVARLRTRWGIEIAWEEYEEANERFRKNNGVRGRQVNSRGDIEGWIPIQGKLIPCVFSVHDDVIATFFAPPPGWKGQEDSVPVQAVVDNRAADKEKLANQRAEIEALKEKVEALKNECTHLNFLISTRKAPPTPPPADNTEGRLLKGVLVDIAKLIREGDVLAASLLADSVASLPRALRLSRDSAVTELIEARCEERVARLLGLGGGDASRHDH